MGSDDTLAAQVSDALAVDTDTFQARVEADAEMIKTEIADGTFDNPQAILGLEYEFYAVDTDTSQLARVPRRLLNLTGFEKELGLHNAELSTHPQPLNPAGLTAQEAEVRAQLTAAQTRTQAEGLRLVSDGLWTLPPAGESARTYLTDSVLTNGIRIASNMSGAVRYHAMANTDGAHTAHMGIDQPHVEVTADTVMPESLITSIQPHYQVPQARDLPMYFRYALRVAGPLLALGVNSPVFPPDLYTRDADPETVIADTAMENRIHVFEQVFNPESETRGKVRFPRDIATTTDAVDRIAGDDTLVPMPVTEQGRFDDAFAHFRLKHGTYWRWVRPVFGGATRAAANARIEFRPVPAQPTIRDTIAFQAAFAGLLESLTRRDHPVYRLEWETARDNFYAAVNNGLDGEFTWITADGTETTVHDDIFADLFTAVKDGLQLRGFSAEEIETYLWPLRQRARHALTPASWKLEQIQTALADGASLTDAIQTMQRAYITEQADTLLDGTFAEWVGRDGHELASESA